MSSILLALVLTADGGTPLDATRARALQLYNTLKYAEACPLMKEVAEQLQTDSGAWSDLGLCLLRAAPFTPPEAAREALVKAWSLATTPQLRSAALFNLTLFHAASSSGVTQLTDPRCPGRSVLLSASGVLHWSSRTTGYTSELLACAGGSDGGCIEARSSRLSLGGDPDRVDPLPAAGCYPDRLEQEVCESLLSGNGLTKAQKASVAKAGSTCDDLKDLPLFAKRLAREEAQCDENTRQTEEFLRKEVAAAPRWRLAEVDVCTERLKATWGKRSLEFKLGNQTAEMERKRSPSQVATSLTDF